MGYRLQSPPFFFIPPSPSAQCTYHFYYYYYCFFFSGMFSGARSLPQPHKLTRYSYAFASSSGKRAQKRKEEKTRKKERKPPLLFREKTESSSCWWFRDVLPSFPWSVYWANHVYVFMHIAWVWVRIDWVQHHRV